MRATRHEAEMLLIVAMLGFAFVPSALAETSPTGLARRSHPRPRVVLLAHKAGVNAIAFAPDGKTLASGGADGSIIVWDVAAGEPLAAVLAGPRQGGSSGAFSPDGRILAAGGGDGTVVTWDLGRREPLGLR